MSEKIIVNKERKLRKIVDEVFESWKDNRVILDYIEETPVVYYEEDVQSMLKEISEKLDKTESECIPKSVSIVKSSITKAGITATAIKDELTGKWELKADNLKIEDSFVAGVSPNSGRFDDNIDISKQVSVNPILLEDIEELSEDDFVKLVEPYLDKLSSSSCEECEKLLKDLGFEDFGYDMTDIVRLFDLDNFEVNEKSAGYTKN